MGCGPHISVSIVPHLLRAYLTNHPNIELRLITGNDHMLFEDLHTGRVDLILMNLPVEGPDLVQDPLWRYELVFVVPPDAPAADRLAVSAAELSARPFILYQRAVVTETANRQLFSATGLIYRRSSHLPWALRALIEVAHQWRHWLPRAEDVLPVRDSVREAT